MDSVIPYWCMVAVIMRTMYSRALSECNLTGVRPYLFRMCDKKNCFVCGTAAWLWIG